MTRKNISLRNNPFLLRPAVFERIWGGSRLVEDFGKEADFENLGETWECSTHPDGSSLVASGEFKGMLLRDLLREHPEFIGTHPRTKDELPVLIKFIDAKSDLSVQVHPDDEYAQKNENGSLGKNEMWYIVDATKDAELIYGFRHNVQPDKIGEYLENGSIEKHLQRVKIQKDDVFYIPAGTVHAIGAGALIAEIQQSSNLTYRLYDYDRLDKDNKKRELHIEKALDVLSLKSSAKPKQPMRVLKYRQGFASELLSRCKYFQVERWLINTERCKNMVTFSTGENSFEVLLCVSGCGTLFCENTDSISFFRGDCIFVPANSEKIKIHGRTQMLKINC